MRPLWKLAVPAAFFAVHAALVLGAASRMSNTYDEGAYIAEGLWNLRTGDYSIGWDHHPPLPKLLAALPLAWAGAATPDASQTRDPNRLGYDLLYRQGGSQAAKLRLARLPTLVFALLTAWGLWLWGESLWGAAGAACSLAAWALLPAFLASDALATSDSALAAFTLWTLYALERLRRSPGTPAAAAAGLAWGLALASKAPAVLLAVPAAWALAALPARGKERARLAAALGAAALLTVAALYRFQGFPWWLKSLVFRAAQVSGKGYPVYFWGRIREGGSPLFYVAAFLLKTPLAWTALFALSLRTLAGSPERRRDLSLSLLFAGVFFAAASLSRTQNGSRYILPVYALGCLWMGALWGERRLRAALAAGLALSALSVAAAWPRTLAYGSELVGTSGLHRWLGESDLDWGQDLPALGAWSARHPEARLTFCYFGLADVRFWGLRAQMLPIEPVGAIADPDFRHEVGEGTEVLAVSASALQRQEGFSKDWSPEKEAPMEVLGGSIYLWDISRRPDAHRLLAAWYRAYGWDLHAKREEKQAKLLESLAGRGKS